MDHEDRTWEEAAASEEEKIRSRRNDRGSLDDSRGKKDGILGSRDRSFEDEIRDDPEAVVFMARANRKAILAELLLFVGLGFAVGFGLWNYLHNHLFLTYYSHGLWLHIALFAPPALAGLSRTRSILGKLCRRFAISRRFIRSELFVGVKLIDSCDMTKVIDMDMMVLGPIANIRVHTKDKTTPIIRMYYIDRKKAKQLASFITAHAQSSYVEFRTSRRANKFY